MEYSPRILPWADWDEWSETSKLLFAAEGGLRVLGVDRVKAWRARGRIPVAVDATASLLEVALLESMPYSRSAHELRSMYSLVIIRAINGLVEGQQTKFYAEPVNVLAGRLGIPQWLVDLRHEATHSQLPSLSSLRMGAQQLLDWLYQEYWQKQMADLAQSRTTATRLLSTYKAVALRAQEESPNALFRACREDASTQATGHRTPSDALVAEALDGVIASVTPTFLTGFLLLALVPSPLSHASPVEEEEEEEEEQGKEEERFLLPDSALEGSTSDRDSSTLCWSKHRQLFLPLLVGLQRQFHGFAPSLLQRLQQQRPSPYSMWIQYLHSRDWHSHFSYGRPEALFALRRAPGINFNLRDKPPENWTAAETEFMQSPASAACVRQGLGGVRVDSKKENGASQEEEEEEEDDDDGWALCRDWASCPIGSAIR